MLRVRVPGLPAAPQLQESPYSGAWRVYCTHGHSFLRLPTDQDVVEDEDTEVHDEESKNLKAEKSLPACRQGDPPHRDRAAGVNDDPVDGWELAGHMDAGDEADAESQGGAEEGCQEDRVIP